MKKQKKCYIYPEKPDNDCWIRNIVFNFPMPVKGKEIKTLPLEAQSTVETVVKLSLKKDTPKIEVTTEQQVIMDSTKEFLKID